MLFAFRDTIYELAKTDKRIVIICTDTEIGLEKMKTEMPNQYLMEGIAEAYIVGMASGLAADGFIPFIVNHCSFITRRSYEQIFVDACMQNRPMVFIGMGGGVASAHLGATHTAIEDLAIMRVIPNMTVVAPCDADEMKRLVPQALERGGPVYIRLARFGKPIVSKEENGFDIGKAIVLVKSEKPRSDALLIGTSAMVHRCISAAEGLEKEGISCSVMDLHTIKPIDSAGIVEQAKKTERIFTVEEHSVLGGMGSAVLEALSENMKAKDIPQVTRIGLPDKFISEYGTQEHLLDIYGLETPHIVRKVLITMEYSE